MSTTISNANIKEIKRTLKRWGGRYDQYTFYEVEDGIVYASIRSWSIAKETIDQDRDRIRTFEKKAKDTLERALINQFDEGLIDSVWIDKGDKNYFEVMIKLN